MSLRRSLRAPRVVAQTHQQPNQAAKLYAKRNRRLAALADGAGAPSALPNGTAEVNRVEALVAPPPPEPRGAPSDKFPVMVSSVGVRRRT